MVKIKVIIGSTRPTRFGIQPAHWLMELAKQYKDAEFELLDLAEVNLPFLDEPQSALTGVYEHEHTKRWSAMIAEADGFVLVTPEYNHGVSAPLKNALDYLYAEWNHKPVSFVSYGAQAGGARSVEHLRGAAGQLKMYDLSEHVIIPMYFAQLDQAGKWTANEAQVGMAHGMLKSLTFWAEKMKTARAELAAR
jgi:NAD(P)H-dependent FMN reductase